MKRNRATARACLTLVFACLVVGCNLAIVGIGDGPQGGPYILMVGGQDKMKTRNPLPAIAADRWTTDVLDRVYDHVGQVRSDTEELLPYIIKGVDYDDDGLFETTEYGVFGKAPSTDSLNAVAYYDFNGVYFHDSVQATAGDLFFSYQLQAMNPRLNIDLRVLMDRAGKSGSNYSTTRWLFMTPATKNWQNEPTVGNASLRVAVRFQMQEPFALFYRSTLTRMTLFPRHVWEGIGWRNDTATGNIVTPLHADFGKAIYPESDPRFGQGIPVADPTSYKYLNPSPAEDSAEEWQIEDAEVIGTGPFRFDSFDPVTGVAVVKKNSLFYTGKDPKTGVMLDSYVASYIHQPYIDGITFKVFATAILGIIALEGGQIDFYHWSLAPEWVPPLINNPNIRIWMAPEPGFSYLAYNMRRPSIGNWNWGQASQFDVGLHFRKAVAHLINKTFIVNTFLQGYGEPGLGPVSPDNVRFYNSSLTGYAFSQTLAQQELDLAHQDAITLSQQPGSPPDAATWYSRDPVSQKIIMPGIGTSQFNLWCPNADYDPVKANSCVMIAVEMNNLGINVIAKPSAFSAITSLINAHDFDMYILGWRIESYDPDYLYSYFHSSNAASGQNYPGFNNVTSDWILDESRKEMDEATRANLLRWAQGLISDKLPYDVLYYRTNIEATRQDRYVGWIQQYGTVWNYWSLLNIHPPDRGRLSISIEVPSAMLSQDSKAVVVVVRDQDGNLIDGANVTLTIGPDWAGNFSGCGGPPTNRCTGQTSLGRFQVAYEAPQVFSPLNVTITATANYSDFPEASRSALVTVFPIGANFLAVSISAIDGDSIWAGGILRFGIAVASPQGFPVDDASVTATLNPVPNPPYGVSPSSGTAVEMTEVTFLSPIASELPLDDNLFTLTVDATHPTYGSGQASIGVLVYKRYVPPLASFVVWPAAGGVNTVFDFDASSSSDTEDPVAALEVRWDWEDDGLWDTTYSTVKTAQHQFPAAGTYDVRLRVRDTTGLTNSTTRQVVVTVDSIPPNVLITSPVDGEIFTSADISVTGTATDSGGSGLANVEVRLNGGSWSNAVGTSSWTASVSLLPGSNTVNARAWDNAGNPSTVASVTVTYNTPPTATFHISPSDGNTTTLFTANASGSSDLQDTAALLEIRWDWEDDGTWETAWSPNKTAQHRYPHPGIYTIRLEVSDTGGLTSNTTEEVLVLLAPPTLAAEHGGSEGTVRLTWTHSDPLDVHHYVVRVYDSESASESIASMNATSMGLLVTGLDPGKKYWFTVTAVDGAYRESDPSNKASAVATQVLASEFPWLPILAVLIVITVLLLAYLFLRRRKKGAESEREDSKSLEKETG